MRPEYINFVVEKSRKRCATTFPAHFRIPCSSILATERALQSNVIPSLSLSIHIYFINIIWQEARKKERNRRRDKANILSTLSRTKRTKTVSDRISRHGIALHCVAMSKNTPVAVNLIGIASREWRLRYRK